MNPRKDVHPRKGKQQTVSITEFDEKAIERAATALAIAQGESEPYDWHFREVRTVIAALQGVGE